MFVSIFPSFGKRNNLSTVPKGRVPKKTGGKCDLSLTGGGGGWRSHFLGDFFGAQKTFVSLNKAPK